VRDVTQGEITCLPALPPPFVDYYGLHGWLVYEHDLDDRAQV